MLRAPVAYRISPDREWEMRFFIFVEFYKVLNKTEKIEKND